MATCADRYPEVFEVWLGLIDEEVVSAQRGALMGRLKAMMGR